MWLRVCNAFVTIYQSVKFWLIGYNGVRLLQHYPKSVQTIYLQLITARYHANIKRKSRKDKSET